MKEQPVLETARLVLRPFDLGDASDVQRLAGDWAIADTTLMIPHPYEDGMAEQWISTHRPGFQAGESANFAIVLRESRDLAGAIGLTIRPGFARAELGYWIGKPYWSRGYCTEAGQALVDFGFSRLNLNRIYAGHFLRNPASGRVMQNLGMTLEGTLRQHDKARGRYEDLVIYGVLRSEWQERRQTK